MKPRVIIRADAGSSIGFGHFVRSAALASYLKDEFDCVMASRNPDLGRLTDYQLSLIAEAGAHPLPLAGADRGQFDRDFLAAIKADDIVVLDNYYYPTEYQREVRNRCQRLVCIDDMHDRHFVADVVMTFCPLVRSDFSLEDYTRFYGGIEWSFLREPFLSPSTNRLRKQTLQNGRINNQRIGPKSESRSRSRSESESRSESRSGSLGGILRVVMAMGGADPFHLTDKMIKIIRKISPEVNIDVLAGQTVAVAHPEDEHLQIHRQADAAEIVNLFDRADLGIFPASTVCVEAFARRLPVAAGHYVDNQEEFYRYGVDKRWFAPLGCLLDDEAEIENRLRDILNHGIPAITPEFNFAAQRERIVDIFRL